MAEFGSIGPFGKMVGYHTHFFGEVSERKYALKHKLHGTFGKVVVDNNTVKFYSKNRNLGIGNDNHGFLSAHAGLENKIMDLFKRDEIVTIYGEWCGQGIHKSTDACCQLPEKKFFVFAISVGDTMFTELKSWEFLIKEAGWLPIPVAREMQISFGPDHDHTPSIKVINDLVEYSARKDKFIEREFGIVGTGEGYVGVLYPKCTVEEYFSYAFKAKTEAHRVRKTKDAAQMNEPMPLDVVQFIDQFVTAARVRQAVSDTQSMYDMSDTPNILSWVAKDVQKEGVDEMEELNIEWKKIAKAVNAKVIRIWKGLVNEESHNLLSGSNDTHSTSISAS